MALMHCPHCGAQNFTMEGWEDLDHCSTCGKPLGAPERGSVESRPRARRRAGAGTRRSGGRDDRDAERPRPA